MESSRSWMYDDEQRRKCTSSFYNGCMEFLNFAFSRPTNVETIDGVNVVRCPCARCQNLRFQNKDKIEEHLARHGFVGCYYVWYIHGEREMGVVDEPDEEYEDVNEGFGDTDDRIEDMVNDAVGPDPPNDEAALFYAMLRMADDPLWFGAAPARASLLSVVTMLLSLKSDCELTQDCFDRLMDILKNKILPENNILPSNFYEATKIVKGLGLGEEKIDMCPNNCMLYYGINADKTICDNPNCKKERFKP